MTVGTRGSMICASTASTAFLFKLKGVLGVFGTGTVDMSALAATSTLVWTFDGTANVDSGISVGKAATFKAVGATVTTPWTYLAADATAGATSLTTAVSTGWKNGDVIAIATTTKTQTQSESKALTADASGTTLTITAISDDHSGTVDANYDTRAEMGNLTRSVKFTGASSTVGGFLYFDTTANCDLEYCEFVFIGSATTDKRGIGIDITSGNCTFTGCSVHDCTVASASGLVLDGNTGSNFTISSNVFYNVVSGPIQLSATSQVHTFNSNIFIKTGALVVNDHGSVWTNNSVAGSSGNGWTLSEAQPVNTFQNNIAHSCVGIGFSVASVTGGTFDACHSWRNGTMGWTFTPPSGAPSFAVWSACKFFGNTTAGFTEVTRVCNGLLTFKDCIFNSGPTHAQATGFRIAVPMPTIVMENCTFGVVTAHATADIDVSGGTTTAVNILARACTFASTVEVLNQGNLPDDYAICSQRNDNTAGQHKTWMRYGSIVGDSVIVESPNILSVRMTPTSASNTLDSAPLGRGFRVPVLNGQTCTPTVRCRKSVAGDGTAYNGNQPKLYVLRNVAMGITADTLLATFATAAGSWGNLGGVATAAVTDNGILEFEVRVDGTTGWVNVGTFSVV
jgi:hypothetical protein